jgi:hypothetical protein
VRKEKAARRFFLFGVNTRGGFAGWLLGGSIDPSREPLRSRLSATRQERFLSAQADGSLGSEPEETTSACCARSDGWAVPQGLGVCAEDFVIDAKGLVDHAVGGKVFRDAEAPSGAKSARDVGVIEQGGDGSAESGNIARRH